MDPLTVAFLVFSCGLGTTIASEVVRRRRKAEAAKAAAAQAQRSKPDEPEKTDEPDPTEVLSIRMGDVIEHGGDTRWPRSALLIHRGDALHCALLLSSESGEKQATVAFAPPQRNVLWLVEVELAMPPSPPGRIEIDGRLLDREALFPALVSARGDEPPPLDGDAQLALYEGSVGDAAVVLKSADTTLVYYGRRLHPDDYDRLGSVPE